MTRVTLLTEPGSRLNQHARAVLARIGAHYRLDIVEIDLSTTRGRELAARHHVLAGPAVLFDGEEFDHGRLSEAKLHRVLQGRRIRASS